MALTDKLTAIADAIRGKTGKTDTLTLDQMATEIAGIETGGGASGEAAELVFETTFSVAESNFTTTKTTLATIQTGLTADNWKTGDLAIVIIRCTNDTETDYSKSHFRERFQTIAVDQYPTISLQSGIIYFYRADTEAMFHYGGANGGVLVSSSGQWVRSLTVQAVGSGNGGGYAVSGDYSLKLYKVNIDFFGLEGLNNV